MPRTIAVTVKPNARRAGVTETGPNAYRVAVPAPAKEGKANAAVIAALAKHLGIAKSRITLRHGTKGKVKVFVVH